MSNGLLLVSLPFSIFRHQSRSDFRTTTTVIILVLYLLIDVAWLVTSTVMIRREKNVLRNVFAQAKSSSSSILEALLFVINLGSTLVSSYLCIHLLFILLSTK